MARSKVAEQGNGTAHSTAESEEYANFGRREQLYRMFAQRRRERATDAYNNPHLQDLVRRYRTMLGMPEEGFRNQEDSQRWWDALDDEAFEAREHAENEWTAARSSVLAGGGVWSSEWLPATDDALKTRDTLTRQLARALLNRAGLDGTFYDWAYRWLVGTQDEDVFADEHIDGDYRTVFLDRDLFSDVVYVSVPEDLPDELGRAYLRHAQRTYEAKRRVDRECDTPYVPADEVGGPAMIPPEPRGTEHTWQRYRFQIDRELEDLLGEGESHRSRRAYERELARSLHEQLQRAQLADPSVGYRSLIDTPDGQQLLRIKGKVRAPRADQKIAIFNALKHCKPQS